MNILEAIKKLRSDCKLTFHKSDEKEIKMKITEDGYLYLELMDSGGEMYTTESIEFFDVEGDWILKE